MNIQYDAADSSQKVYPTWVKTVIPTVQADSNLVYRALFNAYLDSLMNKYTKADVRSTLRDSLLKYIPYADTSNLYYKKAMIDALLAYKFDKSDTTLYFKAAMVNALLGYKLDKSDTSNYMMSNMITALLAYKFDKSDTTLFYQRGFLDALLLLKLDKSDSTRWYTTAMINALLAYKMDKSDSTRWFTTAMVNALLSYKSDKSDSTNYFTENMINALLSYKFDKADTNLYYPKLYFDAAMAYKINWTDTATTIANKIFAANTYATLSGMSVYYSRGDTSSGTKGFHSRDYMTAWMNQKADTSYGNSKAMSTSLLSYKKNTADSLGVNDYVRNWKLGEYFPITDSSWFYRTAMIDALLSYRYLKSDSNSATLGFYPRNLMDAMLLHYYTRADSNSATLGFYSRAMIDAKIAEITTGGGITSLNGLNGASQTFAVDSAFAGVPSWFSDGTTHTFRLPFARFWKKSELDTANRWQPKGLPFDTTNRWNPKGLPFDTTNRWNPKGLPFDTTNRWSPKGTYLAPGDTASLLVSKNYGGNQYEVKGTAVLKATMPTVIGVACSDETTALTASTSVAKVTFRVPYAMTVTAVRASVTTAPTGATILVDIHESGTTILSTKVMIDATELTSTTATTGYVISDSALADDAEITVYADQVGSSVAGAGLKIWIIGTRIAP